MPPIDTSDIKQLGWRQGSTVPDSLISELIEAGKLTAETANDRTFVVLSHSCDVTNADLSREPFVEFISGKLVDENPNLFFAKNSRQLQLARPNGKALEFSIHDRIAVTRECLLAASPDGQLAKKETSLLAKWIARRYARSAFPDQFNIRVSKVERKLHDWLKRVGSILLGVWIDVEDAELPEGQDYEVFVFVVANDEAMADPQQRTKAQEAANRIESHMRACSGISLAAEVQLRSSTEFSIDDYMNTKRWDFDDISLRDDHQSVPNP